MLLVEFLAEVSVHVGILTQLVAFVVGFPDEVDEGFKPVHSLLLGQVFEFLGLAVESVPSSHFHGYRGQMVYLDFLFEFL